MDRQILMAGDFELHRNLGDGTNWSLLCPKL